MSRRNEFAEARRATRSRACISNSRTLPFERTLIEVRIPSTVRVSGSTEAQTMVASVEDGSSMLTWSCVLHEDGLLVVLRRLLFGRPFRNVFFFRTLNWFSDLLPTRTSSLQRRYRRGDFRSCSDAVKL